MVTSNQETLAGYITLRYTKTIQAQELDTTKLEMAFWKLLELEENSIKRLLTDVPTDFWPGIYVGTSGGKDSVVAYNLMCKLYPTLSPKILHTAKPSVTHPKTLDFLYSRPYPILYVPKGHPLPDEFKTQVDGTRASEFDREDGRSTDVIVGGVSVSRENMPLFVRNGLFGLNFIFPIFDWTDEQVWAYIFKNNIPYSDEYLEPKLKFRQIDKFTPLEITIHKDGASF
jgi:3'-phosphoadenosine 5'-phosphosulfate sulfotransferase (PAPS reductase)/FAD synthetase